MQYEDSRIYVLTYEQELAATFRLIQQTLTSFIVCDYILSPINDNSLSELLLYDDTLDLYISSGIIISLIAINYKLLVNYSIINKVDKDYLYTLTIEHEPK